MSVLDSDSKWYQIKYNGERIQAHIKDHRIVGLRNRSNMPVLYLYPELEKLRFDFRKAILDAEVCVFQDGKSVFYGGIDQRRSRRPEKMERYPVKLMVFDALLFQDEVLVHRPYQQRYNRVRENMAANENIGVVEIYRNGKELWKEVIDKDLEGVMVKDPSAIYEIGARSKNNLKLKNYKPALILVEQVEPNSKGTKVFGTATLKDGQRIPDVECQLSGVFDIPVGAEMPIRYLDIYKGRLIQAHKLTSRINHNVSD